MTTEKRPTFSVAMAAYNGEAYIAQQIKSILPQLGENDELVISLDPSIDGSMEIISAFSAADKRVRLLAGPGKGVIRNFEAAISACTKQVIFLADQDDVWHSQKAARVLRIFQETDAWLVMHDADLVDGNLAPLGQSFFEMRRCKSGFIRNLWKNTYIGCCMAFRAEMKPYILPFPKELPMHDQWIGLVGDRLKKNTLLPDKLLSYRRHGKNVTQDRHAGFAQMLVWRWWILRAVLRFSPKQNGG